MDDRIMDLEVKLAFQEKWIADLDDVVRALRAEVDALRTELQQLNEHVRPEGEPVSIAEDKPPHW